MTKKIFKSILITAGLVFISCIVLIMGVLYEYFEAQQKKQLNSELELAFIGVEKLGVSYLQTLDSQNERFTYISASGEVIFDTSINSDKLENHRERQEVKEALEKGHGESIRYSGTLTEKTIYMAKKLPNGDIIRVSISQMTIWKLFISMSQPLFIVALLSFAVSYFAARKMATKIVNPLNEMNLDKPLENEAYDELAPMLKRLEYQQRKIENQRQELGKKESELNSVIANMKEGLVLLSADRKIIGINPAAEIFFNADDRCIGRDFLLIERDHKITSLLDEAELKGAKELLLDRKGRVFQINASSIGGEQSKQGTVLLIFDITDKAFAEQNRREFAANVSHELKTPLHTIMGSSELIENGMVKGEKLTAFAGQIKSEASRLVSLIEDIMHISKLDEKIEMTAEKVNLAEIAESELKALSCLASEMKVSTSLDTSGYDGIAVYAPSQLVREIFHNLCENAVKYNVCGGKVNINIESMDGKDYIKVKDNGIGISKENRERVFERFYRVDKSRSKESGGTGLGLSIVKHAVEYMGGSIQMISDEGKGTEICVCLPKRHIS